MPSKLYDTRYAPATQALQNEIMLVGRCTRKRRRQSSTTKPFGESLSDDILESLPGSIDFPSLSCFSDIIEPPLLVVETHNNQDSSLDDDVCDHSSSIYQKTNSQLVPVGKGGSRQHHHQQQRQQQRGLVRSRTIRTSDPTTGLSSLPALCCGRVAYNFEKNTPAA